MFIFFYNFATAKAIFATDKITTIFAHIQIVRISMRVLTHIMYIVLSFLILSAPGASGQSSPFGLRTVVIDAGHGGKDPGAVSMDKKVYEKNLTLGIAKKLAEKIRKAYPDVKVVMTRDRDVFVELRNRAKIANDANGDLFISIHIDAGKTTSPHGFTSFIMGESSKTGKDRIQDNFNTCARENSVILLEEDYSTSYQGFDPGNPESSILFSLVQNAHMEHSLLFADLTNKHLSQSSLNHSRGVKQDAFWVLWASAMPSVLIECGFISNAADLKILKSENGQEELAQGIFEAFAEYKSLYDQSMDISGNETARTAADNSANPGMEKVRNTVEDTPEVWYGTQILALSRKLEDSDPALKGIRAKLVIDGNIYRYIAGGAADPDTAESRHKEIKKKFPDSFAVKITGDKVERYKKRGTL